MLTLGTVPVLNLDLLKKVTTNSDVEKRASSVSDSHWSPCISISLSGSRSYYYQIKSVVTKSAKFKINRIVCFEILLFSREVKVKIKFE